MTPGAKIASSIELLNEIWRQKAPLSRIIKSFFLKRKFAGSSDRRSIKKNIYAVLRHRSRLNWWYQRAGFYGDFTPRIAMLINLSISKELSHTEILHFFSGSKYHPNTLSKNEITLLSKLKGAEINNSLMPSDVLAEYPKWMEGSVNRLWGTRTLIEMRELNQPAQLDLRINTLKASREDVLKSLAKEGIDAQATKYSAIGLRTESNINITKTETFYKGLIEIQDEGSQMIAILCTATRGMKVIDLCAGAGGKTLTIADTMQNEGEILACDTSPKRLNQIKPRLRRAGITNVSTKIISPTNNNWIKKAFVRADRVLCDVPCSSSGTWRRHPEKKWTITKHDLGTYCETQRQILANASLLVITGGQLIYSTCSILPEENEDQIKWFLKKFPNFQIVPISSIFKKSFKRPPQTLTTHLQLSPALYQTDGFFCAILKKVS